MLVKGVVNMNIDRNNIIDVHIRNKGHSHADASKEMNMHPSKLSTLKLGQQKPRFDNYFKLRDYGISEQELREHFTKYNK